MTSSTERSTPTVNALRDLDYPALVLHDAAIEANLRAMAAYCADQGVLHAPHAKTSLSPQIIERHLRHGAWAMTAATPAQVRGLHRLDVPRILLANTLVDRAATHWIADHILTRTSPDAAFWCYVDSVAGVQLLEQSLDGTGQHLEVLLEVGYIGGRTGTRSIEQSLRVAEHVAGSSSLRLAGVAGYEGLMPPEGHDIPPGVTSYLDEIRSTLEVLQSRGLIDAAGTAIVTAGGSSYVDLVVEALGPRAFDVAVRTVVRSGCYVTHDHGIYRRTSPGDRRVPGAPQLSPALELLASVLSRPEPTLVIAGFGRRDVPYDDQLPILLGRYDRAGALQPVEGVTVDKLNDQHAFLSVPAGLVIAPGELLSFGISHPCGAFDRWASIPLVGEEHRVLGVITTDL